MGKVKDNAKRAVILMAVVGLLFSSVAVTVLYFLDSKNNGSATNSNQELLDQLKQQQAAQSANEPLDGYNVEAFDKASITALKVEMLKAGEGTVATPSSAVKANYFGWTSDGKIFDSSKKAGAVATPIEFSLSGVIPGWTEGLTGVKAGSVVKLIIPADKAYGASGSPPSIGPNEPLEFIVELVEVK